MCVRVRMCVWCTKHAEHVEEQRLLDLITHCTSVVSLSCHAWPGKLENASLDMWRGAAIPQNCKMIIAVFWGNKDELLPEWNPSDDGYELWNGTGGVSQPSVLGLRVLIQHKYIIYEGKWVVQENQLYWLDLTDNQKSVCDLLIDYSAFLSSLFCYSGSFSLFLYCLCFIRKCNTKLTNSRKVFPLLYCSARSKHDSLGAADCSFGSWVGSPS